MAWSEVGSLGATGSSANNQATLALTTTATAALNSIIVVVVADDNRLTGADGAGDEVSSVTDSAGNVYFEVADFANNNGASQAGAAVSIWVTQCRAALASGGTITATFTNATLSDATALTTRNFTVGAGNTWRLAGSNTLANDAADPGSLDVTTANKEHLRIRGIAAEVGNNTSLTATANFTAWANGNSATTGTTAEMCARAEHRIFTGTGSASDPTYVAADCASAYVALEEVPSCADVHEDAHAPGLAAKVTRAAVIGLALASGYVGPVEPPAVEEPAPDVFVATLDTGPPPSVAWRIYDDTVLAPTQDVFAEAFGRVAPDTHPRPWRSYDASVLAPEQPAAPEEVTYVPVVEVPHHILRSRYATVLAAASGPRFVPVVTGTNDVTYAASIAEMPPHYARPQPRPAGGTSFVSVVAEAAPDTATYVATLDTSPPPSTAWRIYQPVAVPVPIVQAPAPDQFAADYPQPTRVIHRKYERIVEPPALLSAFIIADSGGAPLSVAAYFFNELTEPVPIVAPAEHLLDKWHRPFSQPVLRARAVAAPSLLQPTTVLTPDFVFGVDGSMPPRQRRRGFETLVGPVSAVHVVANNRARPVLQAIEAGLTNPSVMQSGLHPIDQGIVA